MSTENQFAVLASKERALPRFPVECQTLIISDLHLGSRHCHIDKLLRLLDLVSPKTIFLNGDIFDKIPKINRFGKVNLPYKHVKFLEKIFVLTQKDVHVHFLAGNHDVFFRTFFPFCLFFNDWDTVLTGSNRFVYEAIDGRAYLITHGDMLSPQSNQKLREKTGRVTLFLGTIFYNLLLNLNTFSRKFFKKEFSLKIKSLLSIVQSYFSTFKSLAVEHVFGKTYDKDGPGEGKRFPGKAQSPLKIDGIICGHIHRPEICKVAFGGGETELRVEFVTYMNSGDWVENCSALIEDSDGTWRLLYVDD